MKNEERNPYMSPMLEMIELRIEKGFAESLSGSSGENFDTGDTGIWN